MPLRISPAKLVCGEQKSRMVRHLVAHHSRRSLQNYVRFLVMAPPDNVASSCGNTIILTIVDQISKMVHCVPLQKLPSANKTAQLLVQHVFRLHGFPLDEVSDREPQFSSGQSPASCWGPPPACFPVFKWDKWADREEEPTS